MATTAAAAAAASEAAAAAHCKGLAALLGLSPPTAGNGVSAQGHEARAALRQPANRPAGW